MPTAQCIKAHCLAVYRPPHVSILGQPYPVHIPTSHLLEIHPKIIHPFTPMSPQWSLSLRIPHQDPIHPLSSPISATCPAQLILLHFITRTILGEKSLIVNIKEYSKIGAVLQRKDFTYKILELEQVLTPYCGSSCGRVHHCFYKT